MDETFPVVHRPKQTVHESADSPEPLAEAASRNQAIYEKKQIYARAPAKALAEAHRWKCMRRSALLLLALLGACGPANVAAPESVASGETTIPDSTADDETTTVPSTAQTTVTTSYIPLDLNGRDHFLTPGVPTPEEVSGYESYEQWPTGPVTTFDTDCEDDEVRETYRRFRWGALRIKGTGTQGTLDIGLVFSDLEEAIPGDSFEDTADRLVVALLDAVDGCLLREEAGSEPTVAEVGPELEGVREITVWRTRSDEGYSVSAHFSMANGFIGAVSLKDYNDPVDFDDIQLHVEDMVTRQPAVIDRINACLERFSEENVDRPDFTAPTGTPPLVNGSDDCAEIFHDYYTRRGYNLNFTLDG